MRIDVDEPCPLPDDPLLASAARALADGGHWGLVLDSEWRLVYVTSDLRQGWAGSGRLAPILIDEALFGPEMIAVTQEWRYGYDVRSVFAGPGALMLADCSGDRARVRSLIDPSLHDLVDGLRADDRPMSTYIAHGAGIGGSTTTATNLLIRIRDDAGAVRGTALLGKPATGMHTLAVMAVRHDANHLDRMQQVMSADRRPAAILFADLERSSLLSRSLSTANYFALVRRLVAAADSAIINAGGIVGRHVGDGVVAYFPAVAFETESRTARACIEAARSIRAAIADVAERSDLQPAELSLRFGLHWGSTVFIGGISTGARSEVTALGDEVNEGARIEACATGGRVLASKQLVERLAGADAGAVDIDLRHVTYVPLGEIPGATDKARRDAPLIAVCEL